MFYRFHDPEDRTFPVMIELFSRAVDFIDIHKKIHITPVPAGEDVSSLSAILLGSDYYELILMGKSEMQGLSVAKPEYLIPLKMKAWMDLSDRKQTGDQIDGKSIKKHRNDIFRLFQIIDPEKHVKIPHPIREDIKLGAERLKTEPNLNLSNFGLGKLSIDEIVDNLINLYG